MFHRIALLTLIAVLWPLCMSAYTDSEIDILKDGLKKELNVVVSPRDSIRVLTNLFDLSPRDEQPVYGWSIYNVAMRVGNQETALDILRVLTYCYTTNDSMLNIIEHKVRQFPDSPEQKESLLFVQMQRISCQSKYDTEEERMAGASQLLAEAHEAHGEADIDIYQQILQCYRICAYLGYTTRSSLSSDYFAKLYNLIEQLPYKLTTLQRFYYIQAAQIYTTLEFHDKAIEADRKLLQTLSQLEQEYVANNRVYRNYVNDRYMCYRRMLANYPAMTRDEIEECYDSIKYLAPMRQELDYDFNTQQRATMYYMLATKNYREALPLIKHQFNYKYSRQNRSLILRAMCTAAEACADSATWINALSEYISYLEDANQNTSAEALRELQIRYDISQLKADNNRLEIERLDNQVKNDRLILGIALSLTVILIILIIILINKYLKSRTQQLSNTETDTDERN